MAFSSKKKQRKYHRGYYKRNRAIIKAKTTLSNKNARERNRKIVDAYLLQHPCVDCGEADIVVLDFDHVRGKKITGVSKMANNGAGIKKLQDEIAKCEIRCANCHRRVTEKRRLASVAQLVEPLICNQQVVGSTPTAGS